MFKKISQDWFQSHDDSWSELAITKSSLQSVLDPRDDRGNKNLYIDTLHKLAIKDTLAKSQFDWILDFGCGKGRLAETLFSNASKIYGVDITCEMLRLAQKDNSRLSGRLSQIDGVHLPFKKETLDCVVAVYVLQYIIDKHEVFSEVINEISEVLKPGGLFILLTQIRHNKNNTYDNECSTRDDYVKGFAPYFSIEDEFPVRLGLGEPEWLKTLLSKPQISRQDIIEASNKIYEQVKIYTLDNLSAYPYVDYIFKLRK